MTNIPTGLYTCMERPNNTEPYKNNFRMIIYNDEAILKGMFRIRPGSKKKSAQFELAKTKEINDDKIMILSEWLQNLNWKKKCESYNHFELVQLDIILCTVDIGLKRFSKSTK